FLCYYLLRLRYHFPDFLCYNLLRLRQNFLAMVRAARISIHTRPMPSIVVVSCFSRRERMRTPGKLCYPTHIRHAKFWRLSVQVIWYLVEPLLTHLLFSQRKLKSVLDIFTDDIMGNIIGFYK